MRLKTIVKCSIYLCCHLLLSQSIQNKEAQNLTNTQINDSITNLMLDYEQNSLNTSDKSPWQKKAYKHALTIKNESLKIKMISRLSYRALFSKDSLLFRQINQTALTLGKKHQDSSVIAEAYWDLADFFKKESVLDSVYYNYYQAQKIYERQGDYSKSGNMLIQIANTQEAVKDYIGAETNIILAIERFKSVKNNKGLFNAYNILGIVSKDLKQYSRAIDYYNKALFYASKLENSTTQQLSIANNTGIVYRESGNYEKAIVKFKEVLNAANIKKLKAGLYAKTLNNLALCKIRIGDTAGLISNLHETIKLQDSLKSSLSSTYYTLAELRLLEKDTATSIGWAEKSIEIAKKNNNNKRTLENLAFLAKIDKEKASSYSQAYIVLNDSLQLDEFNIRNKFARIRFETDAFKAENKELSLEKDLLSQQKRIWAGIAFSFFLLGLSIYIIISQRSKNQKLRFQQQQQENNEEIFNLMLAQKQKVNDVKRLEQKRISEELHDGVLGKMLGARMVLTGLNKKTNEEAVKERSEAISALKNVENEIRAISHELSHTAYTRINNFVNSINSLLDATKANTAINTVFGYDEDEDWDSLVGDIKINVYRIIQESLQNAIKHSECSNFYVSFERTDDEFSVLLRDDGKGFKFEKEKKGIGIRNIRSRVNKLGGKWNIASTSGTEITLQIPFNHSSLTKENTKKQFEDV